MALRRYAPLAVVTAAEIAWLLTLAWMAWRACR
jgi:hypothetical protein